MLVSVHIQNVNEARKCTQSHSFRHRFHCGKCEIFQCIFVHPYRLAVCVRVWVCMPSTNTLLYTQGEQNKTGPTTKKYYLASRHSTHTRQTSLVNATRARPTWFTFCVHVGCVQTANNRYASECVCKHSLDRKRKVPDANQPRRKWDSRTWSGHGSGKRNNWMSLHKIAHTHTKYVYHIKSMHTQPAISDATDVAILFLHFGHIRRQTCTHMRTRCKRAKLIEREKKNICGNPMCNRCQPMSFGQRFFFLVCALVDDTSISLRLTDFRCCFNERPLWTIRFDRPEPAASVTALW